MNISELQTPCLLLDKGKLLKNIETMRRHLKGLGVALRPHVKTPKSMNVMRLVLEEPSQGITVSTLKEAQYFFNHGISDILYAVGIAPVKLGRVAELLQRGAQIKIILDNPETARLVAGQGEKLGVTFPALIEIDSDDHRAGVIPDDPWLIEIGRILHQEKGVELKGVITHAGASYDGRTLEEIRKVAIRERDAAVNCADRLRHAGLPCPIVSIGSTPTATVSENLQGVTEVRAGVYLFQDLVMAGLGICKIEDIALSVLASVIGYQKKKGWVLTDAGWMALSRDRGTSRQKVNQGYGVACRPDGVPHKNIIASSATQEHSILSGQPGQELDFKNFPIGGMVRILPNHACATAGMHDRYYVVDGGADVVDIWERVNGW